MDIGEEFEVLDNANGTLQASNSAEAALPKP
jgi:hypothetical protein